MRHNKGAPETGAPLSMPEGIEPSTPGCEPRALNPEAASLRRVSGDLRASRGLAGHRQGILGSPWACWATA